MKRAEIYKVHHQLWILLDRTYREISKFHEGEGIRMDTQMVTGKLQKAKENVRYENLKG